MRKTFAKFLMISGGLCLLAALFFCIQIEIESSRKESCQEQIVQEFESVKKENAQSGGTDLEKWESCKTIDGSRYLGILSIPALNKSLPVLTVCTDETLNSGIGRYSGSVLAGSLVIGGHNSPAYLWGLSSLKQGDAVTFTDASGTVWSYAVAESEVLNPDQTDLLTGSSYDLSLFNCTWDNTQRFVVRCTLVSRSAAG